jgi:tetratricopeptide (TPR) repeat protein
MNVPLPRNPNFTGRTKSIIDLRASLTDPRNGGIPHIIHGLGGVGKTQLVVHYAHQHARAYKLIWWVRASEPATLASHLAALVDTVDELRELANGITDTETLAGIACRWLERTSDWLLIFDNADSPDDIIKFMPRTNEGHVIITSLNPNWREVGTVTQLDVLEKAVASEFLLKRTGRSDQLAAADLAEELGCLPLALEQAGAYIEVTGVTFSRYLELFKERHRDLWEKESAPAGYNHKVATAWSISMEQVTEVSPAATGLLRFCAFYAPDAIPIVATTEPIPYIPASLATTLTDELAIHEAIAALRRYSLVQTATPPAVAVTAAGIAGPVTSISIHRLVQLVVREQLPPDEFNTWAQAALQLVNYIFPANSDAASTWPLCAILLPHAFATISFAEPRRLALQQTSRLLTQIGAYLQGRAQYREAKELTERALAINLTVYPPIHREIAVSLGNLGLCSRELDDFQLEFDYTKRALDVTIQLFDPTDDQVALRFNHMGVAHSDVGNMVEARRALKHAVDILEAKYGSEAPEIVDAISNYSSILWQVSDLQEAKELVKRALRIIENAHGQRHPSYASSLNNLGSILSDQGEHDNAAKCYRQALEINENIFGPNHPSVAANKRNLAVALIETGDLADARSYAEQALKIDESIYGPDHTSTALSLVNIGGVLRREGDLVGARQKLERALQIYTLVFGRNHKATAIAIANLGLVSREEGNIEEAGKRLEEALTIFERDLGNKHPMTIKTREYLASLGKTEGSDRKTAAETQSTASRQIDASLSLEKKGQRITITWLHLSDWHEGDESFDRRVVRDALLQDIRKRNEIDPRLAQLDFMIFSGDVAFSGKKAQYTAATSSLLNPLVDAVGLSPSKLFFVPGNHDIDRDRFDLLPSKLQQQGSLDTEVEVQTWLTNGDRRKRLLDPFSDYEQFVTQFTGQEEPLYGSISWQEKAGIQIALVGLNSAWMCGRPGPGGVYNDYGHLLVGEPQVYEALHKAKEAHLRIAVIHHPFEWLEEFDQDRVKRRLREECHFILHGHLHKPTIEVTHGPRHDNVMIPAGASYARRVATNPRYTNSYNFVCLDSETGEGTIYFRRWDDVNNRWVVDDSTSPAGRYAFGLPRALKEQLLQASHNLQQVGRHREGASAEETRRESKGSLTIDTRPLLPEWDFIWQETYFESMTAQELIDAVRLKINDRPALVAGEYLEHWVFRDASTRKIYTDIGRYRRAQRTNDTRPLRDVGILPGMTLEVLPASSEYIVPEPNAPQGQ